jgi:hypothetical protein
MEVLIAAIVVSLGMLGLTAVFAGAASQQVRSNRFNDSVAFSRKIEALLLSRVNRLRVDGATGGLAEGVWDAFVSDEEEDYLTSGLVNAVSSATLALEKNVSTPIDLANPPQPGTDFFDTRTVAPSPHRSDATSDYYYVWGTVRLTEPDSDDVIIPINKNRIVPESVTIRVSLSNGIVQDFRVDLAEVTAGVFPSLTPWKTPLGKWLSGSEDAVLPIEVFLYPDQPAPPGVLYYDPQVSADEPDTQFEDGVGYLVLDCEDGFVSKLKMRLEELQVPKLSSPPSPSASLVTVNEIMIDPFKYFDNQLSPLTDRFEWKHDHTFPQHKRPSLMFSPLYRHRIDRPDQIAVFVSSLRALASPDIEDDEEILVPPDTRRDFQQRQAPVREVQMQLEYDTLGQFYYIRPENPQRDGWALRVGQILMMSSIDGLPSAYTTGEGVSADRPVRIMRVRTVDGERVGVLDDAPRLDSRTFVGPGDPPVSMYFWTFGALIESRGDDRTEWAIEPVDVQIFELTN